MPFLDWFSHTFGATTPEMPAATVVDPEIDRRIIDTFVPAKDFFSEAFQSQYVQGLPYTIRHGNIRLYEQAHQWQAQGWGACRYRSRPDEGSPPRKENIMAVTHPVAARRYSATLWSINSTRARPWHSSSNIWRCGSRHVDAIHHSVWGRQRDGYRRSHYSRPSATGGTISTCQE